jgi:hypothetical protein
MESQALDFATDGARLYPGAVTAEVEHLRTLFADQPQHVAGIRLNGLEGLRPFLAPEGAIGTLAASLIGGRCEPVRAILFDKTAETNWSLGWHQDRTICVRGRIDVDGYGPWTVKAGMQHVAPPFSLLARMVTLRVHLDDVTEENAPLYIVPGSHKLGRIAETDIAAVVARHGHRCCLADAGDIWAYATPILHRSKAAVQPRRRRVLQVDYSGDTLPEGLDWLGV